MPLSISNSRTRLPRGKWKTVWFLVLIICSGSIFFCEYKIRKNGYIPSITDSVQLWVNERQKASRLGSKALILVGGSRVQLGIDLKTLDQMTPLTPVQLSINANLSYPVFKNLAEDPDITGTLIVALYEGKIQPPKDCLAWKWVNFYQENKKRHIEPYKRINTFIRNFLESHLVTKLEGAKPFLVISSLLFKNSRGNYLTTNRDRSRDADYSKVQMPQFYANRVYRHLGQNRGALHKRSWEEFFAYHEEIIAQTETQDNTVFLKQSEEMIRLADKIEQRGGKVIFIRFPTSKLPLKYDMKCHPRDFFWNRFALKYSKNIHFLDYPSLSNFDLPDGSHLDMKDKKNFTFQLTSILQKKKWLP
ncbi:MAG: hypothetical protein CSA45_05520 [Gammaproteobacteria bacterium]|nr:MAG: hypothetical protein CSA45_05520 [Gammaproteobacteria bacterium]